MKINPEKTQVFRGIIPVAAAFLLIFSTSLFSFPTAFAQTEGGGGPVTKEDIQSKCLDGSYSKILDNVIQVGVNKLFQGLGYLLGIDVPTENRQISFQQMAGQVEACTRDLIDKSSKVMLQNLKKRLTDQLVNQTIDWIRDKKEPKYVSNFWDFAKDALDVAAGDTIRELDLANLYPDPDLKNYLISVIKERGRERQRTFSQNISFNLDKQVEDVDAFKEDFTEGGFPALIAASDPVNNPMGVAFLTGAYLNEKENQELTNRANEVTSDGFKSDIVCDTWVLVKEDQRNPGGVGGAYLDPSTGQEKVLKLAEEAAKPLSNPPTSGITGTKYVCPDTFQRNGRIVKTPSGIVQTLAAKAVTQQFDYVLSANDVNSYVSGIAEAAISRLMRDGIALFGTTSGNNDDYLPSGIQGELGQYNQNYTGEGLQGQLKLLAKENLLARSRKLIADSSSTIGDFAPLGVKVSRLGTMLFSTSTPLGLVECMQVRPGFSQLPGTTPPTFTGKTIAQIRNEMTAFLNQTRSTFSSKNGDLLWVKDKMTSMLIDIQNITEATSMETINQMKLEVSNSETKFTGARDALTTLRGDADPQIDHIDTNRKACAGPEIGF